MEPAAFPGTAAAVGQLGTGVAEPHGGLAQFAAVSSIFDAAEMVLYVADMDTYELLFMNAQAQRLWGANRAGEQCYKVLQAGQTSPCDFCTNGRLRDPAQGPHPVVWEFQNTVNGHWYLCIDRAIPWPDGRTVRMEVAIDITDRKQHDEFREQYVGVISHDLRSPLSTISVSAAILQRLLERGETAGTARPLDSIRRSTRRMADMIEDLLETTRLESGRLRLHKSPLDLVELARNLSEQLGAAASHPVVCEWTGPAWVLADAGRLERVLENIVGNAFQHSPRERPVRIQVASDSREAVLTVADHGVGISADDLPKLFDRFYRVSGNGSAKGLGLGLYTSRLIVEEHGGRIWAESSPGLGSTFGFALPIAPRPS
jgi:two-component system, OmpR family, phosphate regulon sensor histidine kinase PhoR